MERFTNGKVKRAIAGILILLAVCGNLNTINAKADGIESITQRADYAYNLTWVAQEDVDGWQGSNKYTFYKGNTYRIPYGQPYYSSGYIYYDATFDDYVLSASDGDSIFYTTPSKGLADSTYYAMDCSSFVSYCWGLKNRQTCTTLVKFSTDYGLLNSSNVDIIEQGDALDKPGEHVVLVSRVINNGEQYEITEATPPELKRTVYSRAKLVEKYKKYSLLRYNDRDQVKDIFTGISSSGNAEVFLDAPLELPMDLINNNYNIVGDIDLNGMVTNDDAVLLSSYVRAKEVLTAEQLSVSDYNLDGIVDGKDVLAIMKYVNNNK